MKKIIVTLALLGMLVGLATACKDVNLEGDRRDIVPTSSTFTTTEKLAPANQTNDTPAPEDDSFGQAPDQLTYLLDEWDVYYASEEAAVEMATYICGQLDEGDSLEYVLALLVGSMTEADHEYTADDMSSLLAASVVVYCPWHDPNE